MNDDLSRVIAIRLRDEEIVRRIHDLAEQGAVAWSDHAYDQMEVRGITDVMALRALQRGEPKGEIVPGKKPGEWKAKVVERMKGAREIGVVTILIRNSRLFVMTVEWEDL